MRGRQRLQMGQMMNKVPDSVKLIGGLVFGAWALVTIALPALFIFLPPLLIGGFIFGRGSRILGYRKQEARWDMVNGSTLKYVPTYKQTAQKLPSPSQVNSQIAKFEYDRLVDAFWNNEQGIADYFGVKNVNDLVLSKLESVDYNFESQAVLFSEEPTIMVSQTRSLWDQKTSTKLADLTILLKTDTPFQTIGGVDLASQVGGGTAVLIVKAGKQFVIDTPPEYLNGGGDDEIIVKGRTRNI